MKVATISSYPPRECGIATFNQNLLHSLVSQPNTGEKPDTAFVVAMNDHNQTYPYGPEVKLSIHQEQQADYLEAANYINISGADYCILQHEFGIYGGLSGVYILPLLHRLDMPVVAILHTVLKMPSYNEKAILKEICKMAAKVVVMNKKAIGFLDEIYGVPLEKISFIEHGVPDIHFNQADVKKEFKLEGKKILLTFGFIGRNKGIETVIKALPRIIEKYPDVLRRVYVPFV